MDNTLQKLKKLINPQQLQMTGIIRSQVSKGVYRVQPLGQEEGFTLCTYTEALAVGTRVSFQGGTIRGVIPNTGRLSFVEV